MQLGSFAAGVLWCVGRVQTIGHVKCLLIVGCVIVFLAFCGLRFLLVLFLFLLSVASLIIVGFILLTRYFRMSSVNIPICLQYIRDLLVPRSCQGLGCHTSAILDIQ